VSVSYRCYNPTFGVTLSLPSVVGREGVASRARAPKCPVRNNRFAAERRMRSKAALSRLSLKNLSEKQLETCLEDNCQEKTPYPLNQSRAFGLNATSVQNRVKKLHATLPQRLTLPVRLKSISLSVLGVGAGCVSHDVVLSHLWGHSRLSVQAPWQQSFHRARIHLYLGTGFLGHSTL